MNDTNTLPAKGSADVGWLWTFGTAEVNERNLSVTLKGEPVELEYKAVEVLLALLRHAGEVVTKEELFDTVWAGRVTVDGVLTNAISKLRKVLGEELIATQHRIGYRLVAAVTRKSFNEAASELQLKIGDPVPGRTAWRLLRNLGTGGEGEVWLAEHGKTHEQRVFKFAIDASRLSSLKREATLYRLLREVLGERRDFVRVLEWNFEAAPFFIECEYGGVSLIDWATGEAGLTSVSLEERLRLMAEIAEAVAAAHSAGVLHKDLKPSNVLIWLDDAGAPHARLSDFGISRLADPTRLDMAGITRLGFTVTQAAGENGSGTPMYLAPELLVGQLPTAQSDVYSLGVMLYQLVVGDIKRPLSPGWEQDVLDPMLQIDIAATAHGKPSERMTSADELARRLRTLELRREEARQQLLLAQRAASAEAALQRARARRPLALAVAGALVVGLVVSSSLLLLVSRARDETANQAQLAEAANKFLNEELLAKANPAIGGRSNITVEEAAKAARPGIAARYSSEPLIEASLHRTLGNVFNQLANYPLAEEEFQLAHQLLVKAAGASDEDTLMACFDRVQSLARSAKSEEAKKLMDQCNVGVTAANKPSVDLLFRQAHVQGQSAMFVWDTGKAIEHLEAALALAPKTTTKMQEVVLVARENLGAAYSLGSRPADAEKVLRELIPELVARYGAGHYNTVSAGQTLGQCLLLQDRFAEALVLYESAIPPLQALLGADHQMFLQTRGELGFVLAQMDRWQEAKPVLQDTVMRLEKTLGDKHLLTLVNLNSLANVLYYSGDDIPRAVAMQRKTTDEVSHELGYANAFTQTMRFNLVEMLLGTGKAGEAAKQLEGLKAEELASATPGSDWQARLDLQRARLLWLTGERAAAKTALDASLPKLNIKSPDSRRMRDAAIKLLNT